MTPINVDRIINDSADHEAVRRDFLRKKRATDDPPRQCFEFHPVNPVILSISLSLISRDFLLLDRIAGFTELIPINVDGIVNGIIFHVVVRERL